MSTEGATSHLNYTCKPPLSKRLSTNADGNKLSALKTCDTKITNDVTVETKTGRQVDDKDEEEYIITVKAPNKRR